MSTLYSSSGYFFLLFRKGQQWTDLAWPEIHRLCIKPPLLLSNGVNLQESVTLPWYQIPNWSKILLLAIIGIPSVFWIFVMSWTLCWPLCTQSSNLVWKVLLLRGHRIVLWRQIPWVKNLVPLLLRAASLGLGIFICKMGMKKLPSSQDGC